MSSNTTNPATFWAREPAVAVGLVTSLLGLAASFGFALTQRQATAIVGAVFAAVSLISGFAIRRQVSAPATVIKAQADAQAAVDAAQADKANIIAAIGTATKPARSQAPVIADPAPAGPGDAEILAAADPVDLTAPPAAPIAFPMPAAVPPAS